jgi:hypothetical protein
MPAPLSSSQPGEAWIWGDFVLILQIQPKIVAQAMHQITRTSQPPISPFDYPCAVSAYYRKDRNPHGPSSRPILVACLEKSNRSADAAMRAKGFNPPSYGPQGPPTMIGLFSSSGHENHGIYRGADDFGSVRERLFSIIAERIQPSGEPVQIGPISAIHGHPSTGWPAVPKKKTGCFSIFLLGLLLAIIGTTYHTFSMISLPDSASTDSHSPSEASKAIYEQQ